MDFSVIALIGAIIDFSVKYRGLAPKSSTLFLSLISGCAVFLT